MGCLWLHYYPMITLSFCVVAAVADAAVAVPVAVRQGAD
jgi:hypothetical protein